MQHKKLVEELLDDCNILDTLVGYIELAPELDQLRTHLISPQESNFRSSRYSEGGRGNDD